MSFLKIVDPAKRDLIVKEYLETKKNIQAYQLAERTGEIELQSDLSKIFKPITETQKATTKEITAGLEPIKEGIKGLQESINLPNYSSIKFNISEGAEGKKMGEGEEAQDIGKIAYSYLTKFGDKKDEVDKTYGFYSQNNKFYIGNKLAIIVDNDIVVGSVEYEGTPGLWELIVSKTPDESIYTANDYENYKDLLVRTNALYQNNDPTNRRPKSAKGEKWKNLLSYIWREIKTGKGIIIPGDPNALLQRLDLLMASRLAGNTGVRNELVSICDELKRQGYFDTQSYKNLMTII